MARAKITVEIFEEDGTIRETASSILKNIDNANDFAFEATFKIEDGEPILHPKKIDV